MQGDEARGRDGVREAERDGGRDGASGGGGRRRVLLRVVTIAVVLLGLLVGALAVTARLISEPSTLSFDYEGYD